MATYRIIGLSYNIGLPTGFAIDAARGTLRLRSTRVDVTNANTSNGSAEGVGGLKIASGTAMGYMRAGIGNATLSPGWGTIPAGNSPQVAGNMTVTVSGNLSYSFAATIDELSIASDYAGRQTLTTSFTSSGNITETAS